MAWDGLVWLTNDAGSDWTVTSVDSGESLQSVSLSSDGRWAIAIGTDSLVSSKDGGDNWHSYSESAELIRSQFNSERTALLRANQDLQLSFLDRVTTDQGDTIGTLELDTLDYIAVTASWRLPILVFSLLLVQIFFGLNRYNTRLAAFYFARVDALSLFDPNSGSPPIETIERVTRVLSPDVVGFSRSFKSMAD